MKKSEIDREIEAAANADAELLQEFCEWARGIGNLRYEADDDVRRLSVQDLWQVADAIERSLP